MRFNVETMNLNTAIALVVGVVIGAAGCTLAPSNVGPLRASDEIASETEAPEAAAPAESELLTALRTWGQVAPGRFDSTLPETPVALSFSPSPDGRGYAVRLLNERPKPVIVIIEVRNPKSRGWGSYAMRLDPAAIAQPYAPPTGWIFASGDTLTVWMDGHRPQVLTLP